MKVTSWLWERLNIALCILKEKRRATFYVQFSVICDLLIMKRWSVRRLITQSEHDDTQSVGKEKNFSDLHNV